MGSWSLSRKLTRPSRTEFPPEAVRPRTAFQPRGCGHWGLLSVHPDARGTGVASAPRRCRRFDRMARKGCGAQ